MEHPLPRCYAPFLRAAIAIHEDLCKLTSVRALLHSQGMGVPRDRQEALQLYQRAGRIGGEEDEDMELDDAVMAEVLDEVEGKEGGRSGA